jgi:hypothetical protein
LIDAKTDLTPKTDVLNRKAASTTASALMIEPIAIDSKVGSKVAWAQAVTNNGGTAITTVSGGTGCPATVG